MTTIDMTNAFGALYHPQAALVFYHSGSNNRDAYVEYFDMDRNGSPINAHPLTVREAQRLSKALDTRSGANPAFLKPSGILPVNVLRIDPSGNGSVLWYTKAQKRSLFFSAALGIPNGIASVPPLLWHANKNSLSLFALANGRRPHEKTKLYHAPFFNIYENGGVCMGSVDVRIGKSATLEEFTAAWEGFFFNSYFSHLMDKHNPVKEDCASLWKRLVETGEAFPKEALMRTKRTLKNLLI